MKTRIDRAGVFIWIILVALTGCKKDPPIDVFNPTAYSISVPKGFPVPEIPADNPATVEGIRLGQMLFYDPILSGDSTQSCASCHKIENAFADPRRFSIGIDGIQGTMNAPQIVNPAWQNDFFWNGREIGLEAQAKQPVINPIEMHENWDHVVMKLKRSTVYPRLFYDAFGTLVPTQILATKAIAQFERTFISAGSRFDLYAAHIQGSNFTQEEFNGYQIFFSEKGDCFHCHSNGLFTDNLYHNNGLDSVYAGDQQGRILVTGKNSDMGKFKVPSLRNVEVTAPFMHDGRFATLEEVVEFYNSGVKISATVDPVMTKPSHEFGLQLTVSEKANLVAFLKTLTDTAFLNRAELKNPF